MHAKLFLLCFVSAATAYAGDSPSTQFKSSTTTPNSFDQSAQFQGFLTQKSEPSVLVIGRSDFTLQGPLVYGFRRLPHEDNLGLGQKFLRLPVIRLFVPGPMPIPPEGGPKYFAWKSEQYAHAWPVSASHQSIVRGAAGSLDEAAGREPAGTLLQISF